MSKELLANVVNKAQMEIYAEETAKLQAKNKDLFADLDAECRVSQLLLTEQKRMKVKNDRLKILLVRSVNLLALVPTWNKRHGNLINDISKALKGG